MKKLMIVFLRYRLLKREAFEKWFVGRIFFKFLARNSSVVGLFIDFLTSGLSFVKNCWTLILWCSGGLLCFVFICWVIWGIFEIFVL